MVLISKIPAGEFDIILKHKDFGYLFDTKAEAIKYAKEKGIKSLPSESAKSILNKIKNMKVKDLKYQQKQEEKQRRKEEKELEKKHNSDLLLNDFKKDLVKLDQFIVIAVERGKKFINSVNEQDFIETLINNVYGRGYILQIFDNYYTLSNEFLNKLQNNMDILHKTVVTGVDQGIEFSDFEVYTGLIKASSFKISRRPEKFNKKHVGSFFKYLLKIDIDLSRYGIYKEFINDNYKDNCFVLALKAGGMNDDKLEIIKTMINDRAVSFQTIKIICEKLDIYIRLYRENDYHSTSYGNSESLEQYEICLLDEHYFIKEKTNYTMYSIENYEELHELNEFNRIYMKEKTKTGYKVKRHTDRFCDSYKLIKYLLEEKDKYLTAITIENSTIAQTVYYDKVLEDHSDLKYDEKECTNIIEIKETKVIEYTKYIFDFETYSGNIHFPYLCRVFKAIFKKEGDQYNVIIEYDNSFYGEDCGKKALFSLKGENILLIAHNAKYDLRFLIKYLYNYKEVDNKGVFITATGYFNNKLITIKDSYRLISTKLSKFNDIFGKEFDKININGKKLSIEKDVMPYNIYNKESVANRYYDIEEACKHILSEKDKQRFRNNIKNWKLDVDGKYDIVRYSDLYCRMDCLVLFCGYEIFRLWILELAELDIDKILTIPRIANDLLIKKGCYEGCYALNGKPKRYLRNFIVGGRTMTSENKKIDTKKLNILINDLDATSLYPSAMYEFDGVLKGKPKVIKENDLNYEKIKKYDHYFVTIKILELNKSRKFPLQSIKVKGVRNFTNDLVGKTIYVDKYALEDLIEFQQIKFKILAGYYYDEGFNKQINNTVIDLKNARDKLKKESNPAQEVIKLIMNSFYGYTIKTDILDTNKYYNSEEKMLQYISRNYNSVKVAQKLHDCDKYKVKVINPIDNNKGIPIHVGIMILSYSKRIMNRVMCLAEDNGIDIFYQDTDSMHIEDAKIELLSKLYFEKYGKKLIGNNFGQFKSDFNIDYYDEEKEEMIKFINVISKRLIALGKKCYIDELEGTNIKTGEKVIKYHIRLKGVSNESIYHACDKLNLKNPMEIYEKLYNGEKINFDLTVDGKKIIFKFNKDYTVSTVSDFNRNIEFVKPEQKKKKDNKADNLPLSDIPLDKKLQEDILDLFD